MKRLTALTSTAALALGRALPVRAQAAPVRIGVAAIEEAALPFYAVEKGLFKQAGLDVELIVSNTGGGAITQAVLGGSLDCGVTNSGSISSAHYRGLPLYLIAVGGLYTPAAPIAHLVVNKTLGIKSAKDLAGKTFAVTTLRDMIQAAAMMWIDKNGGDAKTVNFVELPSAEIAIATSTHRIDGGAIVEPVYSRSKDLVQEIGLPYAALADGKPFQTLGLAAHKDWVEKNPALAKRVSAVLTQAAIWANKNHAETTALLARYTKIEPAVIAAIPRLTYAETVDPAYLQPVVDALAHYKILPQTFPARELFAPQVG